ncbi:MAG: hypothetical protein HY266_08055 [Deltaproteobacteria bacterium]|nr:hypothetical protein [Deltaproteobacteria bacterium]
MKKSYRSEVAVLLGVIFIAAIPFEAFAVTAPVAGSFAYDVFDIGVNKILKGPIGFVGGVSAMALGAWSAVTGKIGVAIPAVIGGAVLMKADALVTSLGFLF